MSIDHDNDEPREEPEEEPPVDLDAVEAAAEPLYPWLQGMCEQGAVLTRELPLLIAELRQHRELAERRTRWQQFTVTADEQTPPGPDPELVSGQEADAVLANTASPRAVWGRGCYGDPWYQLSSEPPF